MSTFEFKVKIDAEDNDQAKEILAGMFDIMKTARKETSTKDFLAFANKIKTDPSLVRRAKMFI